METGDAQVGGGPHMGEGVMEGLGAPGWDGWGGRGDRG